jgi:MFS family permease
MELYGRRRMVAIGLFLFFLTSLYIPFSHSVTDLLVARFLQGFFIASVSIGSRALIIENFTGKDYLTGILYVSLAYSLGVTVSPFLGGFLQVTFGWEANFIAYAILAFALLLLLILFISEREKTEDKVTFKSAFSSYLAISKHRPFVAGSFLIGLVVTQQVTYPVVGPFIVQHGLHYSAFIYGMTALFVGLAYVIGVLLNRYMLNLAALERLQLFGLLGVTLVSTLQIISGFVFHTSLWNLVIPLALMNIFLGFVYANTAAKVLQLFPKQAGSASAAFIFIALVFASIAVFILSNVHVRSVITVGCIILIAAVLQLGLLRLSK